MSITGFKMSRQGSQQIMESAGVQALLASRVNAVRYVAESMSGEAYAADVSTGHTHSGSSVPRAHGMVKTTDAGSRRDNLKNNTLLKAFGPGGVKTKGKKK
ncbi:hypothetical protein [Bifidobacterium psychraerophilum]|uniref:hypothetical protein n=1 Tax=Bifidobacterium psychraerophilum TaxID=218140 RepID=UPI0039EAB3CB